MCVMDFQDSTKRSGHGHLTDKKLDQIISIYYLDKILLVLDLRLKYIYFTALLGISGKWYSSREGKQTIFWGPANTTTHLLERQTTNKNNPHMLISCPVTKSQR